MCPACRRLRVSLCLFVVGVHQHFAVQMFHSDQTKQVINVSAVIELIDRGVRHH